MFTCSMFKASTFVKGDNFGTISKIWKPVKMINFKEEAIYSQLSIAKKR